MFHVEAVYEEHTPQLKSETMSDLQKATQADPVMQDLAHVISTRCPVSKAELPPGLTPYWTYRDELSSMNGIVYRGMQAIVPESLRKKMLAKVHFSHLGAQSNIRMCKDIIFWTDMQAVIKDVCDSCGQCAQFAASRPKEPMKSHPIPDYPWQLVSQDLFYFEGSDYLITVDHFSDFIEVNKLDDILSATVVEKSKAHFARHGIPEVLLSDNGPQYTSVDFKSFCKLHDITHVTS